MPHLQISVFQVTAMTVSQSCHQNLFGLSTNCHLGANFGFLTSQSPNKNYYSCICPYKSNPSSLLPEKNGAVTVNSNGPILHFCGTNCKWQKWWESAKNPDDTALTEIRPGPYKKRAKLRKTQDVRTQSRGHNCNHAQS